MLDPFVDEPDDTVVPSPLLASHISNWDREKLEYEFLDLIKYFALHINYVNKEIIPASAKAGTRLSDLIDFCSARLQKDPNATVTCKDILWIITDPRFENN